MLLLPQEDADADTTAHFPQPLESTMAEVPAAAGQPAGFGVKAAPANGAPAAATAAAPSAAAAVRPAATLLPKLEDILRPRVIRTPSPSASSGSASSGAHARCVQVSLLTLRQLLVCLVCTTVEEGITVERGGLRTASDAVHCWADTTTQPSRWLAAACTRALSL